MSFKQKIFKTGSGNKTDRGHQLYLLDEVTFSCCEGFDNDTPILVSEHELRGKEPVLERCVFLSCQEYLSGAIRTEVFEYVQDLIRRRRLGLWE